MDRRATCIACKDKGCSAGDSDLYRCTGCGNEFGAQRFNAKQLRRHAKGAGELLWNLCGHEAVSESAEHA